MRVELKNGEHAIALMSEEGLLQFRDEGEVRMVLRLFSGEPGNMASLRQLLADELGPITTMALTDDQVIEALAPVVARSCVGLVRAELLPVRAADAVEGSFVEDEVGDLFDALVENEFELEDLIPLAILPPTFIQVAEMEANGIFDENKLYKLGLDLLRFVGLKGTGLSEVAPILEEAANKGGSILDELTQAFRAGLKPFGVAAGLLDKATELGKSFLGVAAGQSFNLIKGAVKAGEAVLELLQNPGDDPTPGEAGPAMKDIAGSQAAKLLAGTQSVSETLGDALKGDGDDPAPLTIGPALLNGAEVQGTSLKDAAQQQGEFLQGVMKGEQPAAKDPSPVASALGEASAAQSGQLVDSAAQTAATLTLLGGASPAEKKVLDQPRWWIKPEFPKGARLLGIPAAGVWLVARSDGSKKLVFDVYLQPESGPDVALAHLSPEVKDGVAQVLWVPEGPIDLDGQSLFFEARTEDRRIRVPSPSAPVGDPKIVDEATFDQQTCSVESVGFVLKPDGDPALSGQDQITAGPVFLVVTTTMPGLVELEVRNALAPVDADGNPPKPLITFNVHAEGGRAVVPWNPGKLPPSIRALRIDARPKKGAGDAAEINVLVVPPFLFGDANIDVDETEPEIVEPQPEAAVDAGFFALTPDGPAIPEVPATGAWIIVELANVQQAKVRIFTRDGEHGAREALQTLDLKLKDGRARVQWKPAEPIQRSGMRIGFDVVLAGQIVPGEEAPWVPAFLFGDAAA
ncbi:MAG: hypothetical protein KC549_11370 [Myxococcales bacterium]|nr:hypothetical protein [Myxococcales bacterium]